MVQSQSVVDNLEVQLAELRAENKKHQESSEHLIALMAIHEEAQRRISALEKEAERNATGAGCARKRERRIYVQVR